jgi:hypothetical protein
MLKLQLVLVVRAAWAARSSLGSSAAIKSRYGSLISACVPHLHVVLIMAVQSLVFAKFTDVHQRKSMSKLQAKRWLPSSALAVAAPCSSEGRAPRGLHAPLALRPAGRSPQR